MSIAMPSKRSLCGEIGTVIETAKITSLLPTTVCLDIVPFNVQAIGNDIIVTFVLHQEGKQLETDGPGLGYVDIFSSDGQLLQRLEHGDWLNAPWGVALAPPRLRHL